MVSTKRKADPHLDPIIGANLRALRLSSGLTQENLAEKIDRTFQMVQKYEQGTNRLSCSTLCAISSAIGAPILAFFEGTQYAEENKVTLPRSKKELEILSMYNQLNPTSKKCVKEVLQLLSKLEK